MTDWGSNDPDSQGWHLADRQVVPFVYGGHPFPSGVDARVAPLFRRALDLLTARPGFRLAPGGVMEAGDWGFEVRNVTGGNRLSYHAYALAIDVNAPWNAYGQWPPIPGPYALPLDTGALLRPLGIMWGGGPEWGDHRDTMHLQVQATPAEVRAILGQSPNRPPFPLPHGVSFGAVRDQWTVNGAPPTTAGVTAAIKRIQLAVGAVADGLFGPHTAAAVIAWQRHHSLEVDGLVGPATWGSLP